MESRILKIDLSNKSFEIDIISKKIIRKYIGGRGLGAYLLNKTVKPGIDPLGEENHLIFTAGPASGTGLPYANKSILTTKSPQTNVYLYSVSSGMFSHQIRRAGFWAIDISGIANLPVYISIKNEQVTFKDAELLWGMESGRAQKTMMGHMSSKKAATVAIGPGGEKLIKYAAIMADGSTYRSFARGGCGAVMGSKKLKGVVISGDNVPAMHSKDAFNLLRKLIIENVKSNKVILEWLRRYGTAADTANFSEFDFLPTRNWQMGQFEGVEKICPSTNEKEYPRKSIPCAPFCPSPCSHYVEVESGPYRDAHCDGPEYETVFAFGSNCGIDKFDAIVAAAQICDEHGIDTISAGSTIGFAMECFEKGLIGLENTDGIELRFGNDKAMIATLKKIVNQDGFGKHLGEGIKSLSEKIKGSESFAMHVKGMEFGGYECRGLNGQALQFAISPRGACHHTYGRPGPFEAQNNNGLEIEGKGALVKNEGIKRIFYDSIGICVFTRDVIVPTSSFADVLSTLFGEPWSADDVNKAAIRTMCKERLFNMREGLTRKDDTLPARLLSEPKPDGPTKGAVVPLDELLDDFYRSMNWDLSTGAPTDALLEDLEIDR
jgi:aldehyde:ferredoxin oxidoreductase